MIIAQGEIFILWSVMTRKRASVIFAWDKNASAN